MIICFRLFFFVRNLIFYKRHHKLRSKVILILSVERKGFTTETLKHLLNFRISISKMYGGNEGKKIRNINSNI